MQRAIFITEEISFSTHPDSLIRRITEQLLILEAEGDAPIHVFLDTAGGDIKVALCIFDLFQKCRSPIYTYGLSGVSSAGIIIFLAGVKRFSLQSTYFMSHPSTLSMESSSEDFDATASFLLTQGSRVKKIFKSVLKISEKRYKEMHTSTNYIWAEDALKLKIVTEILNSIPHIDDMSMGFSEKEAEDIHKAITFYKDSKKLLIGSTCM